MPALIDWLDRQLIRIDVGEGSMRKVCEHRRLPPLAGGISVLPLKHLRHGHLQAVAGGELVGPRRQHHHARQLELVPLAARLPLHRDAHAARGVLGCLQGREGLHMST